MNKTIASLALIKTNWDSAANRKDFLDIFVPFIVTLIKQNNYQSIDVNTICKDFRLEYGLAIPHLPMLSILTRTMKSGYICKQSPMKYVPVHSMIVTGDFTTSVLDQERKYEYIIKQFLDYCELQHKEILTKEQAENTFVSFLKDHDLDILFLNQDFDTLLPSISTTTSQIYLINKFVEYVVVTTEKSPTVITQKSPTPQLS